jgi:Helicase HerA, central domain
MARQGNDLILSEYPDGRQIILGHQERLEHTGIVGETGSGKSRFIEHMLRQDLRAWPKTHCGLLLVDPHGDVFDGIISWVAANGLHHLPIVPIDLRRSDRIVSYNVLRRRVADPAVIIDSFVKATAHIWGQPGTDQTPLFERWFTNALYLLYHQHKTLADVGYLFTPNGDVAIEAIDDPMVRRDWVMAKRYRKDFERDTQSLVNRVRRFVFVAGRAKTSQGGALQNRPMC